MTQPLDAAHFRAIKTQPRRLTLRARRCLTCEAAAANGTLGSLSERTRAQVIARSVAAATPPTDLAAR